LLYTIIHIWFNCYICKKEEYIQKTILKLHEFIVDNAELVNGMYKFDYSEEKHQEKFEKLREEMMNCDEIMSSI